MNIRKPTDYSAMYVELDKLMSTDMTQMELYSEIGKAVASRPEKGAAVAAAEYLNTQYPENTGFSPRNLRRMRDFYRMYGTQAELLTQAMQIGWTQNVVIMEAELSMEQRLWSIHAARQYRWSKAELTRRIEMEAHLTMTLSESGDLCYTEVEIKAQEHEHDEDFICMPRQHLPQSHGGVCNERPCKESGSGETVSNRFSSDQYGGNWQSRIPASEAEAPRAWHQLCRQNSPAAPEQRLRRLRPPDRHGQRQPPQYAPHLWRRLRRQVPSSDGLYGSPRRGGRPMVYRQFRDNLERCVGGVPGAA